MLKIKQMVLAALMALMAVPAFAETLTVSAIPQSSAAAANSLPCRLTYAMNASPSDQVVSAMVVLPVRISGPGQTPCLKLMRQKPDGTKQIVAAVTLNRRARMARFFVTAFLREHSHETKFPFYVEQVPGPCATVRTVAGRRAMLKIDSEKTPSFPLADMMLPIWKSHHMVNETLLPVSVAGGRPAGQLLFAPEGKVLVRNFALTKTYREGTDYVVSGNRIRLPAGSSIPFMTQEQLYPDSAHAKPKTFSAWKGGYVLFTGKLSFWTSKQIAVTYDHKADWAGPVPSSAPGQLPRTKVKLRAGQPLKVVLLGDSISAGAEASKDSPPHVPGWGELAMDGLHLRYHSEIAFLNASLGGMVSAWGKRVAPFFVAPEKPDLCIIAFGMNDGGRLGVPVKQYLANTKSIIASVRQKNPDAEFILVASWPANKKWRNLAPMEGYLAALKTLESKHIAVADVWSVASYILKTKRYCDVTGNHVNHPNDFMVRVYAQVTDALLGAE